jgi:hypothetical protein
MTRCLTESELHAVADGEAPLALHSHADACEACRARVESRWRDLRELGLLVERAFEPAPRFERQVRAALESRHEPRGATTIQAVHAKTWPRRAWLSGLAAAVVVIAGLVIIWPSVTGDATLSAAEILGRSLDTLADPNAVEFVEYELQLEGAASAAGAPEIADGALRIQQVIDHTRPGRYRVVSLRLDGQLLSTMAQDPERRLRTARVRSGEDVFFFRLVGRPDHPQLRVSPPQIQRAYLRTVVSVMQATADQKLTTVEEAGETYYAVQVPPVLTEGDAAWELNEARALIRANDFLLKQLTARGTMLDQPFAISFKLVRRDVTPAAQVQASDFEIRPDPGDIAIEGDATDDPIGDVVRAALKELAMARP